MLNISWLKKDKAKSEAVPPDIPGILSIRSVDDLLSPHQGMMVQIDELAGLSERNFNRYYLHTIRNFARFVQLLPASEVHHHAGPGGMLTHTLEVCVNALKIRRSYLLSESGGAEEIAAKQDLWTYAVFLAALSHDLAKVAVDQSVTVYDADRKAIPWSPWDSFLDEQGVWYSTEFQRGRKYRLHEKASLLLIHRIIPSYALNWLSGDRHIFEQWLACVSGDIENASSIGEIVGAADSKSVATNLGADSSRMPAVRTKPLHEKMLTALRHLLNEGELPLNRNGAAGWVSGDDCWLVSKRTVDATRDQLTQEGHSGIPTKNGRMFDILQEHGVLIPYGDKAIWPAVVEGRLS
ncbi:MobH family relaxase [Methylomarinum vadi]|uniref:MobH family relaxase n=1 Tax=Methylomarinum vadi TaxID=438855 RepID=UPI000A990DEC|nr:MobH family relaxase [Methylomarinum vadi]